MKRIKDAIEYALAHYVPDGEPVSVCAYAHYAPSFVRGELRGPMLERFQRHLEGCDECAELIDALEAQADATPLWEKIGDRLMRTVAILITPLGTSSPAPLAAPVTRSHSGGEPESDFYRSVIDLPDGGSLSVTTVRHLSGRRTITVARQDTEPRPHAYALYVDGRLVKQTTSDEGMAFEQPRSNFALMLDSNTEIPFSVLEQEA